MAAMAKARARIRVAMVHLGGWVIMKARSSGEREEGSNYDVPMDAWLRKLLCDRTKGFGRWGRARARAVNMRC
jgi:hypothetical protein